MVYLLSVLTLFVSLNASAQFFGFGDSNKFSSRIPAIGEKLRKLTISATPGFEDTFNKGVKEIENAVEEEKLFCAGEASDANGKTVSQDQRALCFRELKKNYLEAMDVVFTVKKQYLGVLHTQQIQELSKIQKKLSSDIEKNF
jgi:hypothetical protein